MLNTPQQRIPRYILLFKEMNKTFKKEGDDEHVHIIEKIIKNVQDISSYMNSMLRVGNITKFPVKSHF